MKKPPRMLELFKGTGSVGRVFQMNGFSVTSVDIEHKWDPDICIDILKWNYKKAFPPGAFHTIWASPPCTEFSRALTTRARDLKLGNAIVRRTLRIIRYMRPKFWFMECWIACQKKYQYMQPNVPENPGTGLLKRQPQMHGIPFVDLDYCQ